MAANKKAQLDELWQWASDAYAHVEPAIKIADDLDDALAPLMGKYFEALKDVRDYLAERLEK